MHASRLGGISGAKPERPFGGRPYSHRTGGPGKQNPKDNALFASKTFGIAVSNMIRAAFER